MNLTPWQKIRIYIASDVRINVSSRVFQVYCTWRLLKAVPDSTFLPLLLLTIWLLSGFMLPFSGVFCEKYKKSRILILSGGTAFTASTLAALLLSAFDKEADSSSIQISMLVCGILFSFCASLISPLGTPLISEIFSSENEIGRALRLKSSTFVVNLILGPTLAGLLIGQMGGPAALLLSFSAATLGFILATAFYIGFKGTSISPTGSGVLSFFEQAGGGIRRVIVIRAERSIAIASLFANILLVPFIFLLMPTKVIGLGFSMLDLGFIELALGLGALSASSFGIPAFKYFLTSHLLASFGVSLLAVSIFAFASVGSFFALSACCYFLGFGLTVFNITVNTKRAMSIPAGFRAPMESSLLFICTLAIPFGMWISKVALAHYKVDSVMIFGSTTFGLAVLLVWFSSSLRDMLNSDRADEPYYKVRYKELFI